MDAYKESKNGDLSAIESVLIENLNILKDLDERILHLLSLDETVDERDIEAKVESAMNCTINVNKALFMINEKLVMKEEVLRNDDDNRSSSKVKAGGLE